MALDYQGATQYYDDPTTAQSSGSAEASAAQAMSQQSYEHAMRQGTGNVGSAMNNGYTQSPYQAQASYPYSQAYPVNMSTPQQGGTVHGQYQNMYGNGNMWAQPITPAELRARGMATESMGTTRKSKMAAGLLGIFTGSLGIHNFYLGKYGKGTVQLLITLLSGGLLSFIPAIWGLIDGIRILCATPDSPYDYDANGVMLE